MATQVESFWTTSGRVDNFAFEIVAGNDLDKHLGWLEGITGGKLNFGYDTDLKVSGSLDISSTSFVENCVLRVHFMPKLGNEQRDIILCTCIATVTKMNFDKGRYRGSLELRSMLAQYMDDKLRDAFTIGKNKSYKSELKRLITAVGGGAYSISSNVKDKKCSSATAFEQGKAPMEAVQAIADALGGQIGVDVRGRMIIEQYLTPAKRTCSLVLPSGRYSVTTSGIEIEDDASNVPNRVAYKCTVSWKQTVYALDKKGRKQKYTSGKYKGKYKTKTQNKSKVITGRAQVSSSSPISFNKRGRWVSEVYTCSKNLGTKKLGTSTTTINNQLASVQTEMNKKAASKLNSISSRSKNYTLECYYLPISCGQVVEFEYVASGIKLHVQAMVMSIEMNIGVGAKMKVNLKHVRNV